jgi:hypothetical protein
MTPGEAGMTGESRNDAGGGRYDAGGGRYDAGGDVTADGRNGSAVCRTDGGGMSQDVFPRRI